MWHSGSVREPVTAVFNSEGNPVLQELAVTGMKLYFTAVFFAGCNIVLSAYFTSTEKEVPAQISISGQRTCSDHSGFCSDGVTV